VVGSSPELAHKSEYSDFPLAFKALFAAGTPQALKAQHPYRKSIIKLGGEASLATRVAILLCGASLAEILLGGRAKC
jgi:hypothetical protein